MWDTERNRCRSIEDVLSDTHCTDNCFAKFNGANKNIDCIPLDTAAGNTIGSCNIATIQNGLGLGVYVSDILVQGGILIALDTAIGALNEGGPEISVLGIGGKLPAGLMEGLSDVMDWLLKTWLMIVMWGIVATLTVLIGGMLIVVGLDLNTNYLVTGNAVLSTGHGIMLTMVNVAFVIALVVIGIMVILRRREWEVGKTLPRFIAAVALVNFGIFIGSILINISSTIMKAFLGGCPVASLLNAFSVSSLDLAFKKAGILSLASAVSGGGFSAAVFGLFMTIFSLVFSSVFSVIGALTTLAIAVFLIVRYVMVTVLLVFMPVAWLGFAIPKLSIPGFGNPWQYWWKQFMQWIIFGPLITFLLYLGATLINSISNFEGTYPAIGIIQMIMAVIISAGGLFVANKLSGLGGGLITTGVSALAGGAVGLMRKAGGGVGFRGQTKAHVGAEELKAKAKLSSSATERAALMAKAGEMERRARRFGQLGKGSTTSLGATSAGLKAVGIKVPKQQALDNKKWTEGKIKEAADRYDSIYPPLTDEQAARRYDWLAQNPNTGIEKRMALMQRLQKSGKLGLVKDKDDALAMKPRFEAIGTKFKPFEAGLGTTAEIRAAEKAYLRTQETGPKTVRAAQEAADAAKAVHQAATAKIAPAESKLDSKNTAVVNVAESLKTDDAGYKSAKDKYDTSKANLTAEKTALDTAETKAESARTEISRATATRNTAETKLQTAKETTNKAQAELDNANKSVNEQKAIADNKSANEVDRRQAREKLKTATQNRDVKQAAFSDANSAKIAAEADLQSANTNLEKVKTEKALDIEAHAQKVESYNAAKVEHEKNVAGLTEAAASAVAKDYQSAENRVKTDEKDVAFASINLSRAKKDSLEATQKVSAAQASEVSAKENVKKAEENVNTAKAKEADAGTYYQRVKAMSEDISLDPVIRNNAKAELPKAEAEKNQAVESFRNARSEARKAEDDLRKSTESIDLAKKEEERVKAAEELSRIGHEQAETKLKQSQSEFETATKTNVSYQTVKNEASEAKTQLDSVTSEAKAASATRTAAEENLTKTKTSVETATAAELGRIKGEADKWFADLSPQDKKSLPLDNIMTGFDRDKSPMETAEGHSAIQSALVEKTLEKGGKGALNSLLNVKSANFDAASKQIIEQTRKTASTWPLPNKPPKGKNPGHPYNLLSQKDKDIINTIENINKQRGSRGYGPIV